MGAHARGAAAGDRRGPTWSPGPRRCAEAAAARAREARHRHGPARDARTASWRCGSRRDPNVVGLMTHFATADEPGDDLFAAQLEAFREFVDEVGRDDLLAHAANSAAALRDPASHFDMVRCGVAIYGMDPFGEDPAAHGLEPALSLRSWVACRAPLRGGRLGRLRAALDGRRSRPGSPPCRSGYGDGWRRGAHQQLRRADPRPPPPAGRARSAWTTSRWRSAPTRTSEVGDEVVLIGAQGEERILAEEVARPAGHDQLRGHLRAAAAGAPPARAVSRAPGSSAAPCATSCWAARCATSTWRWPATPRGPRARSRPSCAGPCSGCRRRSAPGG